MQHYKQSAYAGDRKKPYFQVCTTFIHISLQNIPHLQFKCVLQFAMAKAVHNNRADTITETQSDYPGFRLRLAIGFDWMRKASL